MINNFLRKKASLLAVFFGFFLLTVLSSTLQAQDSQTKSRKISGIVYDNESNQTIPGISVAVKGKGTGSLTDLDGKYELTAGPSDVLVFSYVGYNSQEVTVGTKTIIDIKLVFKSELLDEVVVVGYGTQNKSHLTGSISKVATNGLEQIPVSRADEALIGKVSGVSIQMTDTKAGASPTIRVRGTGSITADASPLVVMDGVVVGSGYLGSIDMNDVESIEVLKDAASAAIYGSRGGNGVIMITTKQGKEGKTKISFNSYYGTKFTPKYKIMPTISEWSKSIEDYYGSQTDQSKYINQIGNETDWTDVMFDGGIIQSYSLSAMGGNEKTKFAVSGSYLSDEGVLLTDNFKKSNFRVNIDTKVNKYLEVGGNVNTSYTTQRDFPIGIHDAVRQSPWLPLYIDENNIQYVNKTKYPLVQVGDYAYEVYFDGYVLPGNTAGTNISSTTNESALAKVLERETNTNNFKLFSNAYAKINIAKGFTFRSSLAVDYNNVQTESWVGTKLLKGAAGSSSNYSTGVYTHTTNENIFSYNKDFDKHSLSAVAGIGFENWNNYTSSATGTGYQFDYIHTLNAASTVSNATSNKSDEKLQSYLSRLNYAYNDKYLLSLSARWDGSSRFGENNKYGFFPAASAGWRVSEESFLKDNPYISNLKARVSIGVTGNKNGIGLYDATARLQPVTAVVNGVAVTGYNPANIANPDLRWEKSVEAGPGIDMGFFDNKITLSMDYYVRTSKDLLLDQQIPSVTGFSSAIVNIGEVKNSGVEFELSARIISGKNFNWSASANLSHNKNELTNYAGASGNISYVDVKRPSEYIALEGNPISSFYGYVYDRDVPNEYLKQALSPMGATSQDCYVKDLDGDGVITTADRTILGSPYPTLVWGFSNDLSYKAFDLSFTFQGSHGAKVRNMDPQYLENQFHVNMDYVTTFPDKALVKEKIYTDYNIQDASYISLRSLNLGYTLPRAMISKVGLSKTRFYVSGQNLIYLMSSSYTGFNPEGVTDSSSPLRGGYQVGSAPIAKAFTVGVNVEF